MANNIFTLGDLDDFSEKINLDDLYEEKKRADMAQLEVFNKVLNRVHTRIKLTSRQKKDQHCWFIVPEVMIGVPRYSNPDCVAYLVEKLNDNGFVVRYIHPNALFISWQHWVPDYVRNEIKKKTNVVVDGHGNIIKRLDENAEGGTAGGDGAARIDSELGAGVSGMLNTKTINGVGDGGGNGGSKEKAGEKKEKDYKSIDSYKPTGNSIYSKFL